MSTTYDIMFPPFLVVLFDYFLCDTKCIEFSKSTIHNVRVMDLDSSAMNWSRRLVLSFACSSILFNITSRRFFGGHFFTNYFMQSTDDDDDNGDNNKPVSENSGRWLVLSATLRFSVWIFYGYLFACIIRLRPKSAARTIHRIPTKQSQTPQYYFSFMPERNDICIDR